MDLVGGDRLPVADGVALVGSVKWRAEQPFTRADAFDLAAARKTVPGADARTGLVAVSATGFEDGAPVDIPLGPADLLAAWRTADS